MTELDPKTGYVRAVLIALLVVTVSTAIRAMFFSDLGRGTAYLTYYPAIALAALFGGLYAGVLATMLSALLCFYWIQLGYMSRVESMAMGVFIFSSAIVSAVSEGMRRAQAKLMEAHTSAEAKLNEVIELNRKLEDAHLQLLQSEKMASIGQLAAGVAHEINNPVGFVFSNLGSLEKYLVDIFCMLDAYQVAEAALDATARDKMQGLRQELDIDFLRQDLVSLLAETREGMDRVRKIVQDLKDFSRAGSEDEWQWLDVHAGIESTLGIVWNELKYKTTVEKQYGSLPQIYGLPSQLNQVFMNLLVNAAHAIDTKGIVTIRTGQQGEEIWIEVEDTGCGISPENQKRIFDPFFTTKPVGKGTGLGLSVSYTIVQKHHGRIEIRSEVGKGSAFRIWLPINPPEAENNAVPPAPTF